MATVHSMIGLENCLIIVTIERRHFLGRPLSLAAANIVDSHTVAVILCELHGRIAITLVVMTLSNLDCRLVIPHVSQLDIDQKNPLSEFTIQ